MINRVGVIFDEIFFDVVLSVVGIVGGDAFEVVDLASGGFG
jgi:hypothetical protein